MIREWKNEDQDWAIDWHWRPYLIDDRRAARRRYWSSRLVAGLCGVAAGAAFGFVMRVVFT